MITALRYKRQLLTITFLTSAFVVLTCLYITNPIRTPVTDDWLYLAIGSHDISIFRQDSLELINGHQQILVKIVVWILGFIPGLYYSYIWVVNSSFAFLGIYLLIISQINFWGKKTSFSRIIILVMILCNFKPLYLYMSFTGTGLCLTLFFIGIYYYAGSKSPTKKFKCMQDCCAFLAPFATGFGISLAIAHLVQLFFQMKRGFSLKSSKYGAIRFLLIGFSLMFAYVLPLVYKITNPRSPGDGATRIDNIIQLIIDPISSIRFVSGLLGSALVPSSRFEPWLPITLGVILLALIVFTFYHYFTLRTFFQTILLNGTPFIAAASFILMLLVFRGLGSEGSVNESLAPRYVMGTSLLLFSLACLLFQVTDSIRKLHYVPSILIFLMMFSASGVKTGLEWLSVRSQQTVSLYSCLETRPLIVEDCLYFAWPIREGESSKQVTLIDLRKFSAYLEQSLK